MDHQKTGELIARRRAELNMTQRQLAQQLHVSDRTISKWERGAGFPDVSLIEPLADALGLTVVELFHGRREDPPAPEEEHSAREVLRQLVPEVKGRLRRSRRLLRLLGVLLAVAAGLLLVLALDPVRSYVINGRDLSAQQAAALDPQIVITTREYRFLDDLRTDPELSALFSDSLENGKDLEGPWLERLREEFQLGPEDYAGGCVVGQSLVVEYTRDRSRVILTVTASGETVVKAIAKYAGKVTVTGGQMEGRLKYTLENYNNDTFQRLDMKWDPLASLFGR